jgi:hypothetical protein
MLRLNQQQRADLGETLRDAANLIFGGLVVGQVFTDQPLSWAVLAGGLLLWVGMVAVALLVTGWDAWSTH